MGRSSLDPGVEAHLDLDAVDRCSIGSGSAADIASAAVVVAANAKPSVDAASVAVAALVAEPDHFRVVRLATACADDTATVRSSSSSAADGSAVGSWTAIHSGCETCFPDRNCVGMVAEDRCCSGSAERDASSVGSQTG